MTRHHILYIRSKLQNVDRNIQILFHYNSTVHHPMVQSFEDNFATFVAPCLPDHFHILKIYSPWNIIIILNCLHKAFFVRNEWKRFIICPRYSIQSYRNKIIVPGIYNIHVYYLAQGGLVGSYYAEERPLVEIDSSFEGLVNSRIDASVNFAWSEEEVSSV